MAIYGLLLASAVINVYMQFVTPSRFTRYSAVTWLGAVLVIIAIRQTMGDTETSMVGIAIVAVLGLVSCGILEWFAYQAKEISQRAFMTMYAAGAVVGLLTFLLVLTGHVIM